jgi:Cu/Ag efflux pump CusA
MIGMIALAGIIVRNSILLVDFIELQVAQRRGLQGGGGAVRRRARPAHRADRPGRHDRRLLHPGRPDLQRPGDLVSLIFGILVSTLLTLVVIPVLYFRAVPAGHPAHDRRR